MILEVLAAAVVGLPLWIALAEGSESSAQVTERAKRQAQQNAENAAILADNAAILACAQACARDLARGKVQS